MEKRFLTNGRSWLKAALSRQKIFIWLISAANDGASTVSNKMIANWEDNDQLKDGYMKKLCKPAQIEVCHRFQAVGCIYPSEGEWNTKVSRLAHGGFEPV